MVKGSRKSGGACCRGQRGGDHCHGGHSTTQSGGNAHRRQCGSGRRNNHSYKMRGGNARRSQCGAGRKGKGKRGSRSRSRGKGKKGKRGSRKMGGAKSTYAVRGGACNASSVDLGYSFNLNDNIRGRATVVRQRGGNAHENLRYDCKQPDWGPECR